MDMVHGLKVGGGTSLSLAIGNMVVMVVVVVVHAFGNGSHG
jgi:hypothetical protein